MLEGDNNIKFRQDDPPEGGAQDPESVTQYYKNRIQNAGSLVELNTSVIKIDQAVQDGHVSSAQASELYELVDNKVTALGVSETELKKNADHYLGFMTTTTDKTALIKSLTLATVACIDGKITGRAYLEIKKAAEFRINL